MPELKCGVVTCVHNKQNYCDLDAIEVVGDSAQVPEQTSCGSFVEAAVYGFFLLFQRFSRFSTPSAPPTATTVIYKPLLLSCGGEKTITSLLRKRHRKERRP